MPAVTTVHKNVEIIRRGYQAFNLGDLKGLGELFDEKATWSSPGRSPLAGHFKGREAVFAHFGQLAAATGNSFQATPTHFFADEDGRVVGTHHCTGQMAGKRLAVDCCIVFELRNGRVVSGTEYINDYPAWEAFWES